MEDRDVWVRPQVEKWTEGVRDLAKVAKRHPQMAYASLGMLLQLEWQYLQRNILGFGALMEPIESDPRKEFLPFLFGGEEVDDNPRELLGNGVKRGRVGIPYPRKLVEPVHETPEEACKMLVE